MFDVFCDHHGGRVLLGTSRIEQIRNTEDGIDVSFRCYCGTSGIWHTGRRAHAAERPAATDRAHAA